MTTLTTFPLAGDPLASSLFLAALWAVGANLLAILPGRSTHWGRALALIATGVPIVGYVTFQHGPWVGMIVLAMGIFVLRWPAIHAGRWAIDLWRGRENGKKPQEGNSS